MTAVEMAGSPRVPGPRAAALLEMLRPPSWLPYVIRVAVACVVTLYLAFWLELPTPYSAVTTVFIVANPVRGAIVSKSFWRLFGTIVGAVAAVFQFALFGQSPLLFDLFIAVWVGLCCGASTLLRFFPSYGTVLAGYTIVIVDVGALSTPDQALGVALARLSVVVLGIVVTGLVFLLTQRARPPTAFGHDIASSTISTADLIRAVLDGEPLASLRTKRRALALEIAGYEQAIVYASADDLDVRARSLALRVAVTDLLAAMTDGLHAASIIHAGAPAGDGAPYSQAGESLARALGVLAANAHHDRAEARASLRREGDVLASMRECCEGLETLGCVELARLTLERLDNVLADLDRTDRASSRVPVRLRPFLDVRNAARNACRGFLAIMLACLFWYLTYWPAGPTLVAYVAPAAALLSTSPSPGAASVRFVQGTVVAIILAVICQGFILPRTTDFVPAVIVLLLFVLPGAALQLSPKWGGAAFAYVVFFNTNLALENAMTFDLPRLLANAEAYLVGCAALLLTFRILLPPNPALAVRQIAHALGSEGERLARADRLPNPTGWENMQLQRILQIGQRLDAMGSPRRGPVIEDATAGMILGRLVMRLRDVVDENRLGEAAREAARAALAHLGRLRRRPHDCSRELERTARQVLDDRAAPDRLRLAALLHVAARLIATHAEFFDRDAGLVRVSDSAVQH